MAYRLCEAGVDIDFAFQWETNHGVCNYECEFLEWVENNQVSSEGNGLVLLMSPEKTRVFGLYWRARILQSSCGVSRQPPATQYRSIAVMPKRKNTLWYCISSSV